MGVTMGQSSRALRVAANREAIASLLAARGVVVPPAPRTPVPVGRRGTRPLEYVEVGKCPVCKLTWRTNMTGGEVKKHGPRDKPCRGSHRAPMAHAVVLKDLYVPGEKWPKGRL